MGRNLLKAPMQHHSPNKKKHVASKMSPWPSLTLHIGNYTILLFLQHLALVFQKFC